MDPTALGDERVRAIATRIVERLQNMEAASPDAMHKVVKEMCISAGHDVSEQELDKRKVEDVIRHFVSLTIKKFNETWKDENIDVTISTFQNTIREGIRTGITQRNANRKIKTTIDFYALQNKYGDKIYSEHPKTKKEYLSHVLVAESIAEEITVAAVDQGVRKTFYQYMADKGYWKQITMMKVKRYAMGIVGNSATDSMATSIANSLATLKEVEMEKFNSDPDKINLANATFDLRDMTAEPHSESDMFTYANSYRYDPTATCPFTDEMLKLYSCNDEQWIKCFWEIAGFCLSGHYDINSMFWWEGDGANGKSTLQRLLASLVGDAMTKAGFQVSQLDQPFFLNSVIGKRLALCGDADVRMDNINLLKQYTGGDELETDVKFGDMVKFKNTAKLILCMNRPPIISMHEAIKPLARRIVWLPFEYRITSPDSSVEVRMHAELSGIFNRAIEGYARLRAQKGFTVVDRGEKKKQIWTGSANMFHAYCAECIEADETSEALLVDLWLDYKNWMNTWAGRLWETERGMVRSSFMLSHNLQTKYNCEKYRDTRRYVSENGEMKRGIMTILKGIRLKKDTAATDYTPQMSEDLFDVPF